MYEYYDNFLEVFNEAYEGDTSLKNYSDVTYWCAKMSAANPEISYDYCIDCLRKLFNGEEHNLNLILYLEPYCM